MFRNTQYYVLETWRAQTNSVYRLSGFDNLCVSYEGLNIVVEYSETHTKNEYISVLLRVNGDTLITIDFTLVSGVLCTTEYDARRMVVRDYAFASETVYGVEGRRSVVFSVSQCIRRVYNMNQPFTLDMIENARAGYSWLLVFSSLSSLGIVYIMDESTCPNDTGEDSAEDLRTFVLQGTARGIYYLTAKYARHWDESTKHLVSKVIYCITVR